MDVEGEEESSHFDDDEDLDYRLPETHNEMECGNNNGLDEGQSDDSNHLEDEDEELEEQSLSHQSTGLVTGIQIMTQGQVCRRLRRWRYRSKHTSSDDPLDTSVSARDVISYAVRKALQLHGTDNN